MSPSSRTPVTVSRSEWPRPLPVDVEKLPFGWVVDSEAASVLGLAGRFWSSQRLLWEHFFDSRPDDPRRVWWGQQLYQDAASPDEMSLSAWELFRVFQSAGLQEAARAWLDKIPRPSAMVALERAWDDLFRRNDAEDARRWVLAQASWNGGKEQFRWNLLRSKLFLKTESFRDLGSDDFVSTVAVDHDDVWIGTWNGAVGRRSLVTGQRDVILANGPDVHPIKLLAVTPWFVYAFRDDLLERYSKITGTWRKFAYPEGWSGLRVQDVLVKGNQELWVAALGPGLWKWNAGDWTLVDSGGYGPFLNAIADDGKGGLWIGTKDHGLFHWKDGVWEPVSTSQSAPSNVSTITANADRTRWLVGTWGQGLWELEKGTLTPIDPEGYVNGSTWTPEGPLWSSLSRGLILKTPEGEKVLGPEQGLPPGGVSGLATWDHVWLWGTNQGLAWWSEYENSALLH